MYAQYHIGPVDIVLSWKQLIFSFYVGTSIYDIVFRWPIFYRYRHPWCTEVTWSAEADTILQYKRSLTTRYFVLRALGFGVEFEQLISVEAVSHRSGR